MSDLGSWGARAAQSAGSASSSAAPSLGSLAGAQVSRASAPDAPWPVSRLSQTLKEYIDKLGFLWIEGEITKMSMKGNLFAQLRDLQTENAVEIHAWDLGKIDPTIVDGDRVVALIKPTFWPKNGKATMQVYEMKKVGLGELLERIERLRTQLAAEGLTQNKKTLPFLPNCIGLITGKDSDAEKDVLQNAKLRWPEVNFKVINTPVQGDKAAPAIIDALKTLDSDPEVDVIIIARGGGSFLDLVVFSDEALVRAAAAAKTPIVSAIGHENDRPVLDDVADLRASTPTDAAKRVVPDIAEERHKLQQLRDRIFMRVEGFVAYELDKLSQVRSRPILANPYTFITQLGQDLERTLFGARNAFGNLLSHEQLRLQHLGQQVRSLSPQSTLDRGYSVVRDSEGKVIIDASSVKPGTDIKVRLAKGELSATSK
jgi:exodeoxyribonuclease VII large subunit